MDANFESELNMLTHWVRDNSEMNLSFENIKSINDFIPNNLEPCYDHEFDFYNGKLPNGSQEKDLNGLLPEQDENLDHVHIELGPEEKENNLGLKLEEDSLEVDISPAWLHDHLSEVR